MYSCGVSSSSNSAAQRPGRTQAERRAATRTALLEASIACVVDEGYARTTTRRVAERAGVSVGALHHHFRGMAELLSEAVRHLREQIAQEMLAQGPPEASLPEARMGQLLDRIWAMRKGPLFQAYGELLLAARTDPELRATLVEVQHELAGLNATAAAVLFPEVSDQPGFMQVVDTAQAAIRGLALVAILDEEDAERAWPITRAHIVQLSAPFIAGKGSS
jgi:AcrR family transcriptional regulator